MIPVIDFKDYGLHRNCENGAELDMNHIGKEIKDAFAATGFCYLKNHGVPGELVDAYKTASRKFFEQPLAEKVKFNRGEDVNFGYIAVEREKINPERPGDLKEAFNYCPHDDPGKWPDVVQDFQKISKQMFDTCTLLTLRVLDALSVGMGLGKSFMRDAHKLIAHKGNQTTMRSLFYPSLSSDITIKPNQIRLGEHSDYGSITLLFQDDVGGLEVEIPGKGFVPATPIPGTVVVNIGDLMQRWTADSLIATKHRVLIPETEIKKRQIRQSVAYFVHPDDDFLIECLDGSGKYEPVTSLNYLLSRFDVTY